MSGTLMLNGTNYTATGNLILGGGASVVQKTMAEYTALPSAEKMNGSIYKITDKALIYCLDEAYHAVKEITSAQYTALSSAEKNNGTLYILTDEETTAADIPYSSGVSVADKLDSISGLFKIQQFTKTYSCNANAGVNFDNSFITVPNGYTLASVLEFTSGQGSMAIVSVRPNNNGSWAFELKNTSGSTFTNQTFTISVLFVKTEYVS